MKMDIPPKKINPFGLMANAEIPIRASNHMAEGWISTVLNADDVAVLGSHGMFGPVNFEQDENITAPDVIMIRVNREGDIGFASNSLTELIKIEKV